MDFVNKVRIAYVLIAVLFFVATIPFYCIAYRQYERAVEVENKINLEYDIYMDGRKLSEQEIGLIYDNIGYYLFSIDDEIESVKH